ncbi:MAG: IS66 family insertion sequence element accessory protein TnpB [Bacteroides sp.]
MSRIIREVMNRNLLDYNEAFLFYSKNYRKVKILHSDINGYVMYEYQVRY